MILSGEEPALIHQVRLVDIHGTRFLDIVYAHTGAPDQLRQARLGPESVYPDPQPGDAIRVSYLMNIATAIVRG